MYIGSSDSPPTADPAVLGRIVGLVQSESATLRVEAQQSTSA